MNLNDLERRTNSQVGIKIIESCLRQIRTYNDFQHREEILFNFIRERYQELKEVDKIAIKINISIYLKDYEHDYKGLEEKPSTAFRHPFVPEIGEEVIQRILKSIKRDEGKYLESLSQKYYDIFRE